MKLLMESWRSYLGEQEQLEEGIKEKFLAGLAALGIFASPASAAETYKSLSEPMVKAVQTITGAKKNDAFMMPKGLDSDTAHALLKLKDVGELDNVEALLALDKRTRLEDPSFEIITVDFDNTLSMTDSGTANPIVINMLGKETKPVHIVTSRPDTEENRKEIEEFVRANKLNIKGIHFTDLKRKWKTLQDLGSSKHIDNDSREWKTIEANAPEIEIVRVDEKTGKII